MPFPLAVYLSAFGVGLFAQLIQLLALQVARIRIEEFQFFQGQKVASFGLGDTRVQFGWIPVGAFTKYDINQFALLPMIGRVGLIALPSVILLGLGFSMLGSEQGWHHFATGFHQTVEGVFRQQAVGYVLIEKLHALYGQSPMAMVGVVCVKLAAWSLLPTGHVTAPALLQIFSPVLRPNERAEKLITMGMIIGFLMSLVWMGIFLVYAVKHWTA